MTPTPSRWLSRWLVIALIVAAGVLLVPALLPQTLGETARRTLLEQLRQHYQGYQVSIRRGYFDPNVGLIFEDIEFVDRNAPSSIAKIPLARVDRMTVVADIHPELLLNKQLPIETKRVIFEGVRINTWLENAQQLSIQNLFSCPTDGPITPILEVRDANVRLFDPTQSGRPIEFDVRQALISNRVQPNGTIDQSIRLKGDSEFATDVTIGCEKVGDTIDVRGVVKDVRLTPDFFDRLPVAWRKLVRPARNLECVCDTTFAYYQDEGGQRDYKIRTTMHDGRFMHPSLPQTVTQIRGVAETTPGGIVIEASQGMLGDAIVRVDGEIASPRWPTDLRLNVNARGVLLDSQLAATIPMSLRRKWDQLQPAGRVDFDGEVTLDSNQWDVSGTVNAKGVDVQYERFPYPVTQLVGRIELSEGIIRCESLDGRVGGNRMQCAFSFPMRRGITNESTFVVATEGAIPIDSKLIQSLTPRGSPRSGLESFVRTLSPRGSLHLASAVFRTDTLGRSTKKVNLRIADGNLRYQKFPYPLYNVEGAIEVEDDLVKLVGFRATNANAGTIYCDGTYKMPAANMEDNAYRISDIAISDQQKSHLDLLFRAANVLMDDSLRSSLPASAQQMWDSISPNGMLDELTVNVVQHGQGTSPSMHLHAKQNNQLQVTNRTLSLRPASLPYRLDVVGGAVRYNGREVVIDSLTAKHDSSIMVADGGCVRDPSGRWELTMNLHSGSRFHPDSELIAALPPQMREALRRLQLRGPVSLRGQTRTLFPDDNHPEPEIVWNLVLQLEGNRIADMGPVHSLRGELSVKGSRNARGIQASGNVHIDSLHVEDLQITQLRGPFAIYGDRLVLGSGVKRNRRIPRISDLEVPDQSKAIVGKLFDGQMKVNGEVILSKGSFDVSFDIDDAQVTTLLAEFGYADSELTGAFSGKSQITGNLGTTELLIGGGAARLSGANLYQLPLIVQVLNQLRVTPTEAVAFTDGEVEFTLFGDTVTFNDMQMWGDLIVLHGGGTLDRRRELDLTFNTRVSPQNSFTQILRPLSSKRYTLWTIDVKGPISSPEIERRALEGVGETLERLLPGMTDKRDAAAEIQNKDSLMIR